jgi:hypothetical protein
MNPQVIGIKRKEIFLLIPCINQFEHLSANKVIIAINDRHDLSALTQPSGGIVDIWQSLFIDWVFDKLETVFRDVVLLNVGFDLLGSAVLRSVVDVNDVVVLVVLLEDGVQVAQVLVLVLVAGDDYAE